MRVSWGMHLDIKCLLQRAQWNNTLLGICSTSEEIIIASFKEAIENSFIPMFVVTPRQVDSNWGYTGWSQEELMVFIKSTVSDLGFTGSYLVARDHGGPYQSRRDRGKPEVTLEKAMSYAKEMFAHDLRSGFDILHVDATEDYSKEWPLELKEIAKRTAELITYIEDVRRKECLPEVYYEIGTEEMSGGTTAPESFEKFICLLKRQLKDRGCEQSIEWLTFVVGQVGTDMRIDMKNQFDSKQAKALTDIASRHDLFLKVHYTDWLENSLLKQFPKLGVSAANVGPEFSTTIVKSLINLENRERQILREAGKNSSSNIVKIMEELTVKNAPWRRFAPKNLKKEELRAFAQNHCREITLCVGRYIMKDPRVIDARRKLYQNLYEYGSLKDPGQLVIDNVRKAIHRYVEAFNLKQ
jgi:tagatose-1,6-bisphosphate aldolase non-catalytic subunit AgaZ/GatZ